MLGATIERYIAEMVDKAVEKKLREVLREQGKEKAHRVKWARARTIAELFGIGRSTIYEDIKAMEKDERYKHYVMQSGKTKEVNIEGYERYRRELSESYLRE